MAYRHGCDGLLFRSDRERSRLRGERVCMDPAMSTIALCSIFAAAVGTLPLALLYRQLTAVVFRELVFVGEDPVKAAPYLSAAAIFPLLATVAWFVSPLIHHPPAIPGNGGISIPVALWAAAIHAGAATVRPLRT